MVMARGPAIMKSDTKSAEFSSTPPLAASDSPLARLLGPPTASLLSGI